MRFSSKSEERIFKEATGIDENMTVPVGKQG
jgi:hypothetical protein